MAVTDGVWLEVLVGVCVGVNPIEDVGVGVWVVVLVTVGVIVGVIVFVGVFVGVIGKVPVGVVVGVGVWFGDELIDGVGLGVTGTLATCSDTR